MNAIRPLGFPDVAPLELSTVGDWWRFAVSSLFRSHAEFGQGSFDAGQDAVFLVLGALNLPLDSFDQMREFRLTESERKHIFNALRRRVVDRRPTAYVLGFAEQMGRRFVVNEHTLIPRSFIGELLETRLHDCVADPDQVGSVLDLCTGSGCLAILAAESFPDAAIVATDLSADALEVARQNVDLHGVADRVNLQHGDLFAPVRGMTFDLILSNPPYVTGDSMDALPAEFRHEPTLALAAGHDGNDVLRRILKTARQHLNPGGTLVVDMGHNRELVEAAFPRLPFLWLSTAASDGGVFALKAEDLP